MGFADSYLEKQKDFQVKIQDKPQSDLKFVVIIPCFNEPKLIETLYSLKNCEKIKTSIEVIIVINSTKDSEQKILDQNIQTYLETKNWIHKNEDSSFRFFILHEKDLPKKFAGAGLARKIGMDQAICRFNQIDKNDGIIVSMDADSKVKTNYFVELEKHFNNYPKTNVATIYFEHPISGEEFDKDIYEAVSIYELYMRYYKLALNFTGFPYSYYTVGSCFAVMANAYVKQGGMNRKQAGEDFYFLHKVFPLGNSLEINSTCVYPSSRPSERVPFGTGPMVKTISELLNKDFPIYNFDAFISLKIFLSNIHDLFEIESNLLQELLIKIPGSVSEFLNQNNFTQAIHEINQNSSNLNSFTKRFYNWFDAFRVLKFLNFAHDKFYVKKPLLDEAQKLLGKIYHAKVEHKNYEEYLKIYRSLERDY